MNTPKKAVILGLSIKESPEEMGAAAAGILAERARKLENQGRSCAVAVSGGRTPGAFFRKLAAEPFRSRVPWRAIELWWVDERCVPFDDPRSNFGAARRLLLDRVPLAPEQVHPMPVELEPAAGAESYQESLVQAFQLSPGGFPVFDLIFLGLGADGHVASLFPGGGELEEEKRLVLATRGGDPDLPRLTLTLPVLNRAREVIFLATGPEKLALAKKVLADPAGPLPAQRIKPATWIISGSDRQK